MDNYTTSSSTSSYKGIISNQYNQEWMMNSNSSSVAGPRVVVVEEGGEEGGDQHQAKSVIIEKEHMFDKVVTPSDVGKLNRLVIPKQHAEKYFPLDSTINEKGLLLNFEDRTGKPWRFRYSYWNSSQSYVMTKGWSRFVKEKKLDAGDIVSFQRGIGEIGKDKLFIDWRRRPDHNNNGINSNFHYNPIIGRTTTSSFHYNPNFVLRSHPHHINNSFNPYGGQHQTTPHLSTMSLMNVLPSQSIGSGLGMGMSSTGFGYGSAVNPYPGGSNAVFFVRSPTLLATQHQNVANSIEQGGIRRREGCGDEESMVIESVPVVQGKAAAKRLRLFGVNMDCPISNQSHDIDILSSSSSSSNHHRYHDRHHDDHDHDHDHQHQHGSISMGPPHLTLHPPSQSSSRSSSSFFNGRNHNNSPDKGKSSSMSLDLDI